MIFLDRPVVVVAGGPSLKGFGWWRLSGLNVIAINRAYENVPGATMLWWSDAGFWLRHQGGLMSHRAPYKATLGWGYTDGHKLHPDVNVHQVTGRDGYDPRQGCVRTGNNSTYAAIHVAAQQGASAIIVLGLDMKYRDGESHYHGGHGIVHEEATLTKDMIPRFSTLAGPLTQRGTKVINACADSALDVWPRCTIDEGLAFYEQEGKARS